MADARLAGIFIAVFAGQPMDARARITAVAGQGLIGDRYHAGRGTFSGRAEIVAGARALSLMDVEEIARCEQRLARSLAPDVFRRNLVIEGLSLAGRRGTRLVIGEVVIHLAGRCAPCAYLARLSGCDMRNGLYRGGGMRARIERGGELAVGMPVWYDEAGTS